MWASSLPCRGELRLSGSARPRRTPRRTWRDVLTRSTKWGFLRHDRCEGDQAAGRWVPRRVRPRLRRQRNRREHRPHLREPAPGRAGAVVQSAHGARLRARRSARRGVRPGRPRADPYPGRPCLPCPRHSRGSLGDAVTASILELMDERAVTDTGLALFDFVDTAESWTATDLLRRAARAAGQLRRAG